MQPLRGARRDYVRAAGWLEGPLLFIPCRRHGKSRRANSLASSDDAIIRTERFRSCVVTCACVRRLIAMVKLAGFTRPWRDACPRRSERGNTVSTGAAHRSHNSGDCGELRAHGGCARARYEINRSPAKLSAKHPNPSGRCHYGGRRLRRNLWTFGLDEAAYRATYGPGATIVPATPRLGIDPPCPWRKRLRARTRPATDSSSIPSQSAPLKRGGVPHVPGHGLSSLLLC